MEWCSRMTMVWPATRSAFVCASTIASRPERIPVVAAYAIGAVLTTVGALFAKWLLRRDRVRIPDRVALRRNVGHQQTRGLFYACAACAPVLWAAVIIHLIRDR